MSDKPRARGSGPRRLTASELRLWRSVTQSVTRKIGGAAVQNEPDEAPPELPVSAEPVAAPAKPVRKTPSAPPLAPMETRLRQRLARGRLTPEDTLDLHGYRQEQAHRVLRDFLLRAQARGAKLVLVVTGKGRMAAEPGVLRRSVPLWLESADLRSVVVGFGEAAATHGGSGAVYVRLRRTDRTKPRA